MKQNAIGRIIEYIGILSRKFGDSRLPQDKEFSALLLQLVFRWINAET